MIDLSGRVALVTGASRGIGRAIASQLAAQGAHVVAAARGDHANGVAEAIAATGGKVEAIALDVTEPADIDRAVTDGARVINLSLGGTEYSQAMFDSVQDAWNAGLVIVAASGPTMS